MDFKLAVIIGEQVRNAEANMANILSFLDMFGIPYHIYACVDKNGEHTIKNYKNVKRVVSYEEIAADPMVQENTKLCMRFMKRGGWQFIKCNIAADMIQDSTQYTHMIKLRTDSVYRWGALFTKMFPRKTQIEKCDIVNVREMFQRFLKETYESKSLYILGDKWAIGQFDVMRNWLHNFIDQNCLNKMYANGPNGPDHISVQAWRFNSIETKVTKYIKFQNKLINPLDWLQLTWFVDVDNSIGQISRKNPYSAKKLSVGIRGSKAKIKNPIRAWNGIMQLTQTVKKYINEI